MSGQIRRSALVTCLVLTTWTSAPNWAAIPAFQGLGDLPGGIPESAASAVSDDGSTVVGYSYQGTYPVAFRWTSGRGMVGLSLPSGLLGSVAHDVSRDGAVIAGRGISSRDEAFRWTDRTQTLRLGYLPGGSAYSESRGISADGSVVVGFSHSASGQQAFRWTPTSGMVGLGFLPGATGFPLSVALGVSGDGAVVVGKAYNTTGAPEAFRWTSAAGMVGLGYLAGGGNNSEAWAASADGSVIVGEAVSQAGSEAFRWTTTGGMVGLSDLPGGPYHSRALAVSADGSVVVGYCYPGDFGEAFVWDQAHGMRTVRSVLESMGLDLTGWRLWYAIGVSADGMTFVGTGTNPSGQTEAWIATIPEPMSLSLLAVFVPAIGVLRVRCRSVALAGRPFEQRT